MKSETLFRGKADNGKWYCCSGVKPSVFYNSKYGESDDTHIIPETVGAYTGLRALNYERIFEGDILKSITGHFLLVTDAGYGNWTFTDIDTGELCKWVNPEVLSSCKIVDNIHDNPDFVETYRTKF